MSTLVLKDRDQFKAEEVRLSLDEDDKRSSIDFVDAVVVGAVKDQKGKVRLHQAVNETVESAVSGGFWGTLVGILSLNPLLGLA